ncbi:uncharacterized protein LOC132037949 isoform X2 [Lycium ferocissimum]|uniref:uncharacterized protein LOC132037949 isoform X2 n=1 Tax=Lycium ferocissimum TaxID=112874 RepID=UPI002814E069|nr:uncharacterized protein LOC132037949 isoform X2 [Lycium ferocissimum]
MAQSFVSFLIERIEGVLRLNKVNLLFGSKKCVKELQKELKNMKQLLKYAEQTQKENKKIQELIENIRRVAFNIDDEVESYAFKVAKSWKFCNKGSVMEQYKRTFHGNQKKFQLKMVEFKAKVKWFSMSLEYYGAKKSSKIPHIMAEKLRSIVIELNFEQLREDDCLLKWMKWIRPHKMPKKPRKMIYTSTL